MCRLKKSDVLEASLDLLADWTGASRSRWGIVQGAVKLVGDYTVHLARVNGMENRQDLGDGTWA